MCVGGVCVCVSVVCVSVVCVCVGGVCVLTHLVPLCLERFTLTHVLFNLGK